MSVTELQKEAIESLHLDVPDIDNGEDRPWHIPKEPVDAPGTLREALCGAWYRARSIRWVYTLEEESDTCQLCITIARHNVSL